MKNLLVLLSCILLFACSSERDLAGASTEAGLVRRRKNPPALVHTRNIFKFTERCIGIHRGFSRQHRHELRRFR